MLTRRAAVPLVIGLLVMAACGDDAPDRAAQAERAEALAAEYRAGTTVPVQVPPSTTADQITSASANPGPVNAAPATTAPVETVDPTGVVVTVTALDNSFRPEQITIQVGDEVLWENRGRNEHNILNIESADEGFDADGAWGIDVDAFQPGAVFAHVFTEPGNYRYYCTIHGNTEVGMVGTIIVEA